MEQIAEDEHISSIESKLNSLIRQSSDLERRLSILERPLGTLKAPTPPPTPAHPTKISHNYLNRVISEAWRGYKKW